MATFTIASGRAYGREIRMERANGVATQLRTDSIQASARVKADARRLFQALISPEYVEAWLTIPGAGGPWIVSPIVSRADLAWECSPANGEPLHIQADFLVARRRRLFIRWKLNRNSQQLENRISMRLIGDFDHTTLSLCHVGFNNHDQLQWHHELWHASLNRLVNLYRNGAHFN